MVSLKQIRASNTHFKTDGSAHLVAVFVGATSGIGLGTLRYFARNANAPIVYIVGRSRVGFAKHLAELVRYNAEGRFVFIESEISLIRSVDTVCDAIRREQTKVDLLFMSAAGMEFGGRHDTIEGIDTSHSLRYYSRMRFIYNLLQPLQAASQPRVISILSGGKETAIDVTDLELRRQDFSMVKAATYATTQTTLAMEHLATTITTNQAPGSAEQKKQQQQQPITFIHQFPGFVDTGVLGKLMWSAPAWALPFALTARFTVIPLLSPVLAMSVDEAGERGLFLLTSDLYDSSNRSTSLASTPSLPADANSHAVHLVGPKDDLVPAGEIIQTYRADGTKALVWEATVATWERALATHSS